jgi:hypothetical protein
MLPAAAALWLGLLSGPALAGSVYRCLKDGSVAYTQRADDPSCQPIEVNAHEPDPDEAARQQDELRKWREDRGKLTGQRRERRTAGRARSRNVRGDEPPVTPAEGGDSLKLPPELDFKPQDADSRN